jgi:hypothetical protein
MIATITIVQNIAGIKLSINQGIFFLRVHSVFIKMQHEFISDNKKDMKCKK